MIKFTSLNMSFRNYAAYADAREACGLREVSPPYSALELVEFFDGASALGIVFW